MIMFLLSVAVASERRAAYNLYFFAAYFHDRGIAPAW